MISAYRGVDHLYTKVADIHAARAALHDLGFSMTSLDEQAESAMGLTSVVFQDTWLAFSGPIGPDVPADLNAVVDDADRLKALPDSIAEQLSGLGGQPIIILGVEDMDAFVRECARLELQPSDPEAYPRVTVTETGSAEIRFQMTVTAPVIPGSELEIVGLKHLTPDIFFRPALLAHENGAEGIQSITLPASNADGLLDRLADIFGQNTVDPGAGISCRLKGATLRLQGTGSEVDVLVRDLHHTREVLSSKGIDVAMQGESLFVQDLRLGGLLIRFLQSA